MARSLDELAGDYINSQDIIDRLAELEDMAEDGTADEDEQAELIELREFAAEGEEFSDWQYGETFIPEDQFENYARELAEDIGAIKGDESWPLTYIDWPAAARDLQMDYTPIELRGVTYYARA